MKENKSDVLQRADSSVYFLYIFNFISKGEKDELEKRIEHAAKTQESFEPKPLG